MRAHKAKVNRRRRHRKGRLPQARLTQGNRKRPLRTQRQFFTSPASKRSAARTDQRFTSYACAESPARKAGSPPNWFRSRKERHLMECWISHSSRKPRRTPLPHRRARSLKLFLRSSPATRTKAFEYTAPPIASL